MSQGEAKKGLGVRHTEARPSYHLFVAAFPVVVELGLAYVFVALHKVAVVVFLHLRMQSSVSKS